jgi:multiple sugar transport system substrate-binding protein
MRKLSGKRCVVAAALSAVVALSGCNLGGNKEAAGDTPTTIKVMYYDENQFFSDYGMLFSAVHPEVEVEVVSTQNIRYDPNKDMNEETMKFIEEQKPDILMLQPEQYTKLAEQGKLYDLSTQVESKDFNQEGLLPGLLDYLKELGGGKIYGLVPNFYAQAIYYNKDLFDKYKIPLPHDKMSWDELLQLARRFPTDGDKDSRVYGLKTGYSSGDLYSLGNMLGSAQNLSAVNPVSMQVTINTDAWKKVFRTAQDALASKALYFEDPSSGNFSGSYEEYLLRDPFIGGRLAMTIDGTYMMEQIKRAQSSSVKDKVIKNWGLVTVPVDPEHPDSSTNVGLSQIFAVNAQSANTKAAWTFLNYITSDEYARVTSKVQRGSLSVRTNYLKDDEGHNLQAFYALKPMQSPLMQSYSKVPQNFLIQFQGMAQQELQAVQNGQKSLDDALAELQTKGQQALMQAQQEEAAKKPGEASPSAAAGGAAEAGGGAAASAVPAGG